MKTLYLLTNSFPYGDWEPYLETEVKYYDDFDEVYIFALQILLIDDGSEESFRSEIRDIARLDERIKVITQSNLGVSAARNEGIKHSKGKYLTFVDADDVLVPYFFSEAVHLCEKENVDFLIGGNTLLDNEEFNEEKQKQIPINYRIISDIEKESFKCNSVGELKYFGNMKGYYGRGPWTRLIKREIAENTLFNTELKIEEYKNILTQIFNVLVMLVFPSVTGLILLSKEVVLLISGKEYIKATGSLKLLSIALIFCIFGWIYNQCVLIPARKEKIVLIATLVSALANIAINFVCIPFWRENAVAFSTIVAEAIMMLVCVYVGRKIVRLNAGVAYNICTVCAGCIGIWMSCKFVKHFSLSSIATLVLSILLSCIVYGMCLILMRNKVIWAFFKKKNKSELH